jgi:hypothetical protein
MGITGSNDKFLEVLDFVINVLKEHEQGLDKSIGQLASVVEELGETQPLAPKITVLEEKINTLQGEIKNLNSFLAHQFDHALPVTTAKPENENKLETIVRSSSDEKHEAQLTVLHCKQWQDFKMLAEYAQILAFSFKESDKSLKAYALRDRRLIVYMGDSPDYSVLVKSWLSTQLKVSQNMVFEGSIEP